MKQARELLSIALILLNRIGNKTRRPTWEELMKLVETYEFKKVPGGARVKSRSKPRLLAWTFLGVRLVAFIGLFIGINEASG